MRAQLVGEVHGFDGAGRGPDFAEEDRLPERADHHPVSELDGALRVGMAHVAHVGTQDTREARGDVRVHAARGLLDDGVDAGPEAQASEQAARWRYMSTASAAKARTMSGGGTIRPSIRIEHGVAALIQLGEEALVHEVEERILVREATVEGADGDARLFHDLDQCCLGEALGVENMFGCVEYPVERLLASMLLWGTKPRSRHES